MIKIVLIDDDKLFCDAMRCLLERENGLRVVAYGGDGESGLTLVKQYQPDLLLFDVRMPVMDGLRFARELAVMNIKIPSIAVTACDDTDCLAELTNDGVSGFVLKTSGKEELFAAIRAVSQRKIYIDPSMAARMIPGFQRRQMAGSVLDNLSPREKAVLYWISQGFNNLEIAEKMLLSDKTVKNHVRSLLKKLELRDRTQMAALAWKLGLAKVPIEVWSN